MAKNIKLNIQTAVDLQGVKQLKNSLQEIQTMMKSPDNILVGSFSAAEIQKTINAVNTLDRALDSAFDVNLQNINIEKFNKYLKDSNMTVNSLYKDLSRLGIDGQKAFLQMTQATLTMGNSIKRTNQFINELKTTFSNTVKWGISSGSWNKMLSSVSKAFTYIKGLNADLNDIRIVTGKSADQMERFAKQANKAAKDLAVSTRDYTQGALIYYQQGLSDEEVATRTNITAKASNVTGQDMSTVSEQLTAVWNGYQAANEAAKEGMQVYEQYVDKMAAVAASTASDLEEQATAMSKVASAAYSMGVGFDELNAQISTIVSVTRQAPESIGTALKTIYARLGDLQVDGVDEFGTSLGDVSGKLQTMGIEVMDSNGQMREMDEVMTDVAAKWDTWTDAQKQAAAVAMAGKRQYNNLIALFDNWDMYGESLKTSMESAGTLSEQQSVALDSLENKMEKMQTAAEKFYDALFDEESLGGMIEVLTSIVDIIGSLTQGLGGLKTILPIVGGILLKTFKNDIGKGITSGIINLKTDNLEKQNDVKKVKFAQELSEKTGLDSMDPRVTKEVEKLTKLYQELYQYKKLMSKEDIEHVNKLIEEQEKLSETILESKKQYEELKKSNTLLQERTIVEDANEQKDIDNFLMNKAISQKDKADKAGEEGNTDFIRTELSNIGKNFYEKDSEDFDIFITSKNEMVQEIQKQGGNAKDILYELRIELEKIAKETGQKLPNGILENMSNILLEVENNAEKSWEMIIKNTKALQDFGEEDETLRKIKKRFIELKEVGESTTAAYSRAVEEVANEGQEAQIVLNKLLNNESKQDNQKEAQELEIEKFKMQDAFQNLANAAGGATMAIGGVVGMINAFKAAGDTTLTSTERWKAALSGTVTSIMMIGQGAFSAIQGINGFTQAMGQQNIVLAWNELVKKGNIVTNGLLNKSTLINTIASKMAAKAKLGEAAATEVATAANYSFYASCVVLLIIIAAIIAIVATVTAIINTYAKSLENSANKAKTQLEAQEKITEAAREEKQAIEELTTTYEDLKTQYDDETLTLTELRTKTYDLCMQYEQQDLAVQTLTASYDELNNIMKEAQESADDALQSSLESEQKLRTKAITRQYANDQGATSTFVDENGRKLDISNQVGDTATWFIPFAGPFMQISNMIKDAKLLDVLEKYGIEEDATGKIDSEKFFTQASVYFDEMLADLENIDSEASRNLVNAMIDNQDLLKENTEALKELREYRAKNVAGQIYDENNNIGTISSAQEYNQVFNQIVNTLIDTNNKIKNDDEKIFISKADTEEEKQKDIKNQVEQWVTTYLAGFAQSNNMAQRALTIEKIQDKKDSKEGNFSTESLDKQLSNFSKAEFEFITTHLDLATAYDDLNTFIKDYEKSINYLNSNNFDIQMKMVLDDEAITEEEIEELYSNYTDFAEKSGYNQDEFKELDYSQQTNAMIQYYLDTQQYAIQTKETVVQQYQDELEAYQKLTEEKAKNAEEIYNTILKKYNVDFSQLSMSDEFGRGFIKNFSEEELSAIMSGLQEKMNSITLDNYKTGQWDELGGFTAEEDQFIEAIRDRYSMDLSDLKDMVKEYNSFTTAFSNDKYLNTINSFNELIKDASNNTVNYIDVQKQLDKQYVLNAENLDNLQSEYSDLIDIANEYNKNGFLSIDSMQKLINMDTDTLAALQWDKINKTMSLNTEYMKNNLIIRLQEAKATIYQEGNVRLLALAEEDETIKLRLNTIAKKMNTDATLDASNAALQAKESWEAAVNALVGTTSQEAQLVIDETNKKLQAVDDTIAHINENPLGMITGETVDKDDLKLLDEEIDRYWEIDHALGKIEQAMDDVKRIQDKLHGKELIKSLKEENKLLEEQDKAYKKLLEEQHTEAAELQTSLQSLGVDFYEDGGIANYEEAMTNAINAYNAVMSNSAASDSVKEAMEKKYEKFVDKLERYDQLFYGDIEETLNNIDENKLAELENNLKAWEIEIELNLDKQQLERDLNDFVTEIGKDLKLEFENLDSVMKNLLDNSKTYGLSNNQTIGANVIAMQETMAEIDKLMAGKDSNMFASVSEAQEKLKELFETTQDETLDLKDLYADMWNTYMEGIDQSAEKFENIIEQYDTLAEKLENQKELIELIYGEEAYNRIGKIYEAQKINTLSQIESLKQQVDIWTQFYNAADEDSADKAKYLELMNEAQSSLNEKLTEYVKILKDDYINTINKILQGFQKDITGSSLDEVSQQWDKIKEKSDKYFDSVESLYEIQSFANNIQMSIDETTTLKNQQKLQALYDKEIEYLREKENLTQYDLDAAEARYQIALKEIALEEAQNAKDSMKLTRGTDGNWSYQYVADEDDILAKQQDLSSAYNDLYQLANSAYEENLNSLIQLQTDYKESAMDIANNDLLNEEQKQIKFEELRREYLDKYKLLAQENALYRNDLNLASSALLFNLYNQDIENYNNMTEAEKELTESLKNSNIEDFQELQDKVAENYDNIKDKAETVMSETLEAWESNADEIAKLWNIDDGESVTAIVITATENMQIAWNNYLTSVTEGAEAAGEDISNLGEDYSNITTEVNSLKDATQELVNSTTSALEGYKSAMAVIGTKWDEVKGHIEDTLKEAKKYFDYVGTYTGENIDFDPEGVNNGNKNGWNTVGDLEGGGRDNLSTSGGKEVTVYAGTSKSSKITSINSDKLSISKYVSATSEKDGNFYWVTGGGVTGYITEKDYQKIYGTTGQTLSNKIEQSNIKKRKSSHHSNSTGRGSGSSFDTGGYTGDWGSSEGRLAVLHQKELILNSKDTENILNTVQVVRNIETGIMNKISSILLGLSNLTQTTYIPAIAGNSSTTDNVFNITAEFPNANDVTSIREAILSLPNIASQYIAENKK